MSRCIDNRLDMATDKTLATFRIDPQEWEAFKNIASAEGSSASALLIEFVRWHSNGNRINADTTLSADAKPTHLPNLDDKIDERIDCRLGELRIQLEELRGKLKA